MVRLMTPRHYFRDTADVYTRAAGGLYTVLARAALPCRVDPFSVQGMGASAPTGAARTELAMRRQFVWEPTYALPPFCQIQAEGVRWNPVNTNATQPVRAPISGEVIAYQAELVRAA